MQNILKETPNDCKKIQNKNKETQNDEKQKQNNVIDTENEYDQTQNDHRDVQTKGFKQNITTEETTKMTAKSFFQSRGLVPMLEG